MVSTDFEQWVERARAVPIESEIVRRRITLRRSGSERIGPCPKCGGTDRFSVNVKEGVWNCRQCKPAEISGDVIGLVMHLDGCDFKTAVETLEGHSAPQPNSKGNGHDTERVHNLLGPIIKTYDYTDEAGEFLFQVTRHDPKDFRQRTRGRNGEWVWSLAGVRLVPYRLPELIEAVAAEQVIFIVEGEKDVDNVIALGAHATCNPRGAGKWGNCQIDQHFEGAHVVVIADNDPQSRNKKTGELLVHPDGRPRHAGWDHANDVCQHLSPIAASVRIVDLRTLWPGCPEKADVTNWIEAGGTIEALNDIAARAPSWPYTPPPAQLSLINIRAWQGTKPPERGWEVQDRIPSNNVTLLSGQGGVGKTLLMQQLSVATVLGRDWIGLLPQPGPVLFITAEDDEAELHYRYDQIARHYGTTFTELADAGLNLMSLAGKDSVMAIADNRGIVKPTDLFRTMVTTAREIRPRWIVLDTVADIFVVNERDRSEVRQCISLCRGLSIELSTAVILLAHPSLTGISSGTGLSGSTAWNNSVRSRLYLKVEKVKDADDDEHEPDAAETSMRVLETMKSNYAALGSPIRLLWKEGLFIPDSGVATLPQFERAALDERSRAIFLVLLERYNRQNLTVTHKDRANNYAPKIFAEQPEAIELHKSKGQRKKLLRGAMDYLLSKERIYAGRGPQGAPPSKQTECLYRGGTLL